MKKALGILISLLIVVIPTTIYGKENKEETTSVVIAFHLNAEDRFIYEVRVNEGGYLVDGSQKITNGIMEYELSVGQKKEFRLEAKRGYEIKEIRDNGKLLKIEEDEIEIAGVSAKSVLEVKYGRIEEPDVLPPPDNTNIADGTGGTGSQGNRIDRLTPITADMLRISEYVCLMLIVLYRIYVSKRGINTQQRDDNIAISKNIEKRKETLKEEKRDEK